MTITEAITQVDALQYNDYPQSDKISWLSRLDGMVKKLILDMHEGGEATAFNGYDAQTDPETELLVAEPYDDIYLRWLEAQIHYHNGEYDRYNNAILMFNTAYTAYENYYNRLYMPRVPGGNRFVF